jgi:hypothetical protein
LFWVCVSWNGPGLSRSKTESESWNYEPTHKLAEIETGKVREEDKFDMEVETMFTIYCKVLILAYKSYREWSFLRETTVERALTAIQPDEVRS